MKKIICVFLAAVLMVVALCGCQLESGNQGSTKSQAQQFTQADLTGTWTLKFTYNAFFKNMAAMADSPAWIRLMTNVSSKAKFEITMTFAEDGTCTYSADPEAVMIATEQFGADLQSYLYDDGVYDLLYMENTWGKSVVDKKLQEWGKTKQEYADEVIDTFLPGLEGAFAMFAETSKADYTLADNLLTILVDGEVFSLMRCRYDGTSNVVFKQDSPEDVCPFAGMDMTRAE